MKLSTRGRYGVRLMFDLALHKGNGPVALRDVAERQEISEKYLSNIIPPLKNAGLVKSVRGAQGGYILAKDPRDVTLKDILLVLEGPMCLVECTDQPRVCNRADECLVREIWSEVSRRMLDAFDAFTLESMVERKRRQEKVLSYSI